VLKFASKQSEAYRSAKRGRRALKKELEEQLGQFGELKLDAPPFILGGEALPSVEDLAIDELTRLHGQRETWSGYYDLMCKLGTHPSLAPIAFAVAPADGGSMTVPGDLLNNVTATALQAYHAALGYVAEWCGWDHAELIGLGEAIGELVPGTFDS
jgi:hypothetical protein